MSSPHFAYVQLLRQKSLLNESLSSHSSPACVAPLGTPPTHVAFATVACTSAKADRNSSVARPLPRRRMKFRNEVFPDDMRQPSLFDGANSAPPRTKDVASAKADATFDVRSLAGSRAYVNENRLVFVKF